MKQYLVILLYIFMLVEVHADDEDMPMRHMDNLSNLENRVALLEKNYTDTAAISGEVAELQQKIAGLEEQLRSIRGEIEEMQHKGVVGREALQQPNTEEKAKIVLGEASVPPSLTSYAKMIAEKKYNKAIVGLQKFIDKNKNSKDSGVAYYLIAETYSRKENHKMAAKYYLRSYKNYPTNDMAPDSLLKLAQYTASTNKPESSCKLLQKLEIEYPDRSAVNKEISLQEKEKLGCEF